MENINSVALRLGHIYIPGLKRDKIPYDTQINPSTLVFVKELSTLGYTLDEESLRAINTLSAEDQAEILDLYNDIFYTNLNWVPVIKDWTTADLSDYRDKQIHGALYPLLYLMTYMLFGEKRTDYEILPCGCPVFKGLFDLSEFNGCPICGKPFKNKLAPGVLAKSEGGKKKKLSVWLDPEPEDYLKRLLQSPVALDATQQDSLKLLLECIKLTGDVEIGMKETLVTVAKFLADQGREEELVSILKNPADVLRFLWYEKTDQLQIIRPVTLIRAEQNADGYSRSHTALDSPSAIYKRKELKLKYPRSRCRTMARVMNSLSMSPEKACQIMHPRRGMWVKVIRALRLPEFARKPGYEYLRQLLDIFYNNRYRVDQSYIDEAMRKGREERVMEVYKKYPGLFARQLFSLMLRYRYDKVLNAFKEIEDRVPLRLILTLAQYTDIYFNTDEYTENRSVRIITGKVVEVPLNPLLKNFNNPKREKISDAVTEMAIGKLRSVYASLNRMPNRVYIDPALMDFPIAIGERSKMVQGASAAVQGMKYPVQSDKLRIFIHWGKDMSPRHLDLDLSALMVTEDGKTTRCNYSQLQTAGAKHSGDMQMIPNLVGTAEFIEFDVSKIYAAGYRYVIFYASNYTPGAMKFNALFGWMNTDAKMTVDYNTGVAYDPATVEMIFGIPDSAMSRALVFGILDTKERVIEWLEMPMNDRVVDGIDYRSVLALKKKLAQRASVGKLLHLMADAQGVEVVNSPDRADQVYDTHWAADATRVSELLLKV